MQNRSCQEKQKFYYQGKTITGKNKTVQDGVYVANNELISSFIIINAASMDDASEIAGKCPIFEFLMAVLK